MIGVQSELLDVKRKGSRKCSPLESIDQADWELTQTLGQAGKDIQRVVIMISYVQKVK